MALNLTRDIADAGRLRQILSVLFKYEFGYLIEAADLTHLLAPHQKLLVRKPSRQSKGNPERLRKAFEELGGTFIKLGQLLSLRPDLVTREYSAEFAKLQDSIKPFPARVARRIIERELKQPIKTLFRHFDDTPIAAASIGQVHCATLHNGTKVAIKIKRPGVAQLFATDTDLLHYLAHLLKNHVRQDMVDPEEIIKEFEKYTIRELDYVQEAKSIQKFAANFEGDKTTKIPRVHWKYTTSNIITMEYMHGIKLSDHKALESNGYNKKKIAENLVNSVFKQIFIDGFFHADPHPANVLVQESNTIGLLDFGITGFLDEKLRDDCADLFMALIDGDVDMVAECLISLGFVDEPINMETLKEDIVVHLSQYRGTALRYVELGSLFGQLINIARENRIKLPVNFILMGKAIVTVESSCVLLNPDFNLLKAARPFVLKLEHDRTTPQHMAKKAFRYTMRLRKFLSRMPEQSEQFLMEIKDADLRIKAIDIDLKNLTSEIGSATNHFIIGIIIVSLVIASALMIQYDDRFVIGIPYYSFIYLALALCLTVILLVSNTHKVKQ